MYSIREHINRIRNFHRGNNRVTNDLNVIKTLDKISIKPSVVITCVRYADNIFQ